VGGKPSAEAAVSVLISDRHFVYVVDRLRQEWTLTLNARSRPKILDVRCTGVMGFVYRGVYRLDGDTLTICSVRSICAADRPKDFRGSGPGQVVEVFRRLPSASPPSLS
jgi:uncharacterized protein (TIGR03067 family)